MKIRWSDEEATRLLQLTSESSQRASAQWWKELAQTHFPSRSTNAIKCKHWELNRDNPRARERKELDRDSPKARERKDASRTFRKRPTKAASPQRKSRGRVHQHLNEEETTSEDDDSDSDESEIDDDEQLQEIEGYVQNCTPKMWQYILKRAQKCSRVEAKLEEKNQLANSSAKPDLGDLNALREAYDDFKATSKGFMAKVCWDDAKVQGAVNKMDAKLEEFSRLLQPDNGDTDGKP